MSLIVVVFSSTRIQKYRLSFFFQVDSQFFWVVYGVLELIGSLSMFVLYLFEVFFYGNTLN